MVGKSKHTTPLNHFYIGWLCLILCTAHCTLNGWKKLIEWEDCIFPGSEQMALVLPAVTILLKIPLLLPCVDRRLTAIRKGGKFWRATTFLRLATLLSRHSQMESSTSSIPRWNHTNLYSLILGISRWNPLRSFLCSVQCRKAFWGGILNLR